MKPYTYKESESRHLCRDDGVLFAERANESLCIARLIPYMGGVIAKASVNSANNYVICRGPEAKRSNHGQDESTVKGGGGPNPLLVQ